MILAKYLADAGSMSYPPLPMQMPPFLPILGQNLATPPYLAVQKSGRSSNGFPIVLQKDKHEGYGVANGTIQSRYTKCEMRSLWDRGRGLSPGEYLDDTITASTHHPAAILAPNNGTDALSAHDAVTGNLLGAASSFEGPEAKACVVAS